MDAYGSLGNRQNLKYVVAYSNSPITVLRIGPYRFHFYTIDGNEPPHIHVRRDRNEASGSTLSAWPLMGASRDQNCGASSAMSASMNKPYWMPGMTTLVLEHEPRAVRVETDDERVTVHLTEDGNKLIRAIFPRHLARIKNEFEILSLSEQENLSTLCRTLGRSETARSA